MRRRRWGIAGVCAGAVLVAGAVVFHTVAVPALVRFPLDVDETATSTGTASTYVDQATLLPLPVPRREPLTLSRHVKVVEGSFDTAALGRSSPGRRARCTPTSADPAQSSTAGIPPSRRTSAVPVLSHRSPMDEPRQVRGEVLSTC